MLDSEFTGRIRIVTTPAGEAPLWVREAWVGLRLPCWPLVGLPSGPEVGVLSSKEVNHNCFVCHVPQDEAIVILRKERPEAAKWWEENNFPQPGKSFTFREEEIRMICGVRRTGIIHVTEEMMGDPNR